MQLDTDQWSPTRTVKAIVCPTTSSLDASAFHVHPAYSGTVLGVHFPPAPCVSVGSTAERAISPCMTPNTTSDVRCSDEARTRENAQPQALP